MYKQSQIKYTDNLDGTTTMSGFPSSTTTAILDTEDVPKIQEFSKHWHIGKKNGYVRCVVKQKTIELHRVVMNTYDILKSETDLEVDHINRDKLDNRKENLRLVTHAENMLNKDTGFQVAQSRFKGYVKRYGRFYVQVCLRGKCHFGGSFFDESEASKKAIELRESVVENASNI